MTTNDKCLIWETDDSNRPVLLPRYYISPRAGGMYAIEPLLSSPIIELNDEEKARLTTILVNERRLGKECPIITWKMLEEAKEKANLSITERANRLLQYLAQKTPSMGENIDDSHIEEGGCAWSESIKTSEFFSLCKFLEEQGWIECLERIHLNELNHRIMVNYPQKVTPQGYIHLEELRKGIPDSSKASVGQTQIDEKNEYTESNTGENEDDWQPLPIDHGNEQLIETIKKLTDAIEGIRADNGYAASKPNEQQAVLSGLETGKKELKERYRIFKYEVIAYIIKPLKKAAETFTPATILGGKIASALNGMINLAKTVWGWFL